MNISIKHTHGKSFSVKTAHSSFIINPDEISPLEYFAGAILACSGVDIVSMAQKNSVELESFSMDSDIVRSSSYPMKFNEMLITYKLKCAADVATVRKWVLSSIQTYCSTISTIRSGVSICFSIELNGKLVVCAESIDAGLLCRDEEGLSMAACCVK